MAEWTVRLNQLSRKEFSQLFATASVPVLANMAGYYRTSFVGPAWLRAGAGPTIAMGGLSNWWGKHIREDGTAVNLVRKGEQLEPRLAMRLIDTTSLLDGRHTLALVYDQENPFPWPYVVDEIRRLDPGIFLGMTYVNAGPLRRIAFPFLLQYQEQVDGL
jgi:hypothetical protein